MSNKMKEWLFPLMSFVIFGTLFAALLAGYQTILLKTLISYAVGLLAYALMLTVLFLSSRPRWIEQKMGLPNMYEIHGYLTIIVMILIAIHVALQWTGQWFSRMSVISQTGYIAVVCMVLVFISGFFSLSSLFIARFPSLLRLKEHVFNRELMLWMQRGSLIAIVAVYVHIVLIPYLQSNLLFIGLLTFYTLVAIGYYARWKWQLAHLPDYQLVSKHRPTSETWRLTFRPKTGGLLSYRPGYYFFIRFKTDTMTREAHPFSVSSAITYQNSDEVEFIIKEVGDWTGDLAEVTLGSLATLEGPYGNFYPSQVEKINHPLVLIAGGIGITPLLSILRFEHNRQTGRKIDLIWGVNRLDDLFAIDEFNQMRASNPNFRYHIILSGEKVDGYAHGFVDETYLNKIGLSDSWQQSSFHVCGPAPMLTAMKNLLANKDVPSEVIYIDDFSF